MTDKFEGESMGRIIRLPPRGARMISRANPIGFPRQAPQVAREEADDYRHRMIANALAFIACVVLVVVGVWIADTMAQMRKNQDCVLSGRRGCTPVDVPVRSRW
jgi:hypothetical protein